MATKKQKKRTAKKKALDSVTASSSSDVDNSHVSDVFTLSSVLKSYLDPRCDIFSRSVKAEIAKYPGLLTLTPKDAERDPPDIMFGGRRKGYYKCPRLCRVYVMEIFRWLRSRGEWFVKWHDKRTGKSYDGTIVLAHAFAIKYISKHKPGMSIKFSKHGHLKSTSHIFNTIKRQVIARLQ